MESIASSAYRHSTPLPLLSRPTPLAKTLTLTLKPHPRKPLLSLRASHNTPLPRRPSTLPSLLKPAAATLAAAAALLLARFHHPPPSLAAAAPAPQSETLETPSEADKERILEDRLAARPDDIRSLRALMEIKVKSAKLPEAIAIIDRLIPLEPGTKDLPLLRAHLHSYAGDTDAARSGFEALLAEEPFLVEAYHGLVMCADGDLSGVLVRVEAAMDACRKANRKEDLRDFKLLLAQIWVIDGKYDEALKVYQELVKEDPKDFRPYLCQGIIYTLLRKNDEAEKQFQKYRRLVPKGHPYAEYFDDNMVAMKAFSQMEENKRRTSMKA